MNEKTKKIVNKTLIVISILVIAIYAFAITPKTFQNDTYYTIKIGEHIVNSTEKITDLLPWNKGLDMKDPFSWHKNLPYTYPHWLYDVGTYAVYLKWGFEGIYYLTCALAIIFGLTIFGINKKLNKTTVFSFFMTIGVLYCLKGFIAARAQLVTFILFALTYFSIERFLKTKKIGYAIMLIIIPILIANLHCAVWPFYFVLYLPVFAEQLIITLSTGDYKYIGKKIKLFFTKKKMDKITYKKELNILNQNKKIHDEKINEKIPNLYKLKINKEKNVKWLVLIFIICLFTGLLTPIKDTPYTYLYKTEIGNTTQNINEHLPLTLAKNKNMIVILISVFGILTFTRTKITIRDFFMLMGLILMSFMSQRQVSILVLIGNFILLKLICDMIKNFNIYIYGEKTNENTKKNNELIKKDNLTNFMIIMIIFSIFSSVTLATSVKIVDNKKNDSIVDDKSYPVAASNYILNNIIPKVGKENLHLYNEYNYGSYLLFRGIPVFIDSRADLYAPEFNGKKKENGKYEGRDIFTDFLDISSLAADYNRKFNYYNINYAITYSNSKLNSLMKKDKGWEEVYSDEYFVIYEKI